MDRLQFLIINSPTAMKNHLMSPCISPDTLIEELLSSPNILMETKREQYLLRQTMYSLMRLSKSEQLLAIRQSVNHLVPASSTSPQTRRTKGKRNSKSPCPGQSWLAFGK
jgi:hypothetical protein